MKKTLLAGPLIIFIGLTVLVSALDGKMTGGNDSSYTVEIDVQKGWNIIAGILPNEAIASESQIKANDIKAVWYYAPNLEKHVQIHPDLDMSAQIDDDVALTSAMWVYSAKEGRLKYSTLEDYMPLPLRELSAGYNFVTITPDMYSGILDGAGYDYEYFIWDRITEDCNTETINAWDPENQDWISVESDLNFGEEINDFIGMGMVVKVSNDCNLNEPAKESTQPPQLPSGNSILIESDIPPFIFRENNERTYWEEDCVFTNKGEKCKYYRAIYDYSGDGIDVIEVQIEVPSTTWDITEDTFTDIDSQLEGIVLSDDEYWKGNFYWFSQSSKEYESTMDRFLSWKNDNKLIMISIVDYDSEEFDWNLIESLIDAYFNKYPSSYQT